MSDIVQLFAALDGARIPGGCDHCHAYQTLSVEVSGVAMVHVHHDDWCPWWRRHQRRTGKRGSA